ncbi:MAG: DUF2470 domain-containing protein [Pseudomonadota bacterium]
MAEQENKDLLQPVDNEVRLAAKTLIRTARYGALSLLDIQTGAPTIARVGIATDTDGLPVFPISSLSGRVEGMQLDGRASLLLGEPGRGDPLAHRRISLNGVVRQMTESDHERVRGRYLMRHPKSKLYIDFKDFSLWKLDVQRASYIGGFGRAHAMTADDFTIPFDDWESWNAMEAGAVEHMNDDHTDATLLYATVFCRGPDGDWRITGLDPEGIDLALGDDHRRYTYEQPLRSAQKLRPMLVNLVRKAREESNNNA